MCEKSDTLLFSSGHTGFRNRGHGSKGGTAHSPGCRHTRQWETFFDTLSNTSASFFFHWLILKPSQNSSQIKTRLSPGKSRSKVTFRFKKKKSYFCSRVWPFRDWIYLSACSLPTPNTPSKQHKHKQLTLMIQNSRIDFLHILQFVIYTLNKISYKFNRKQHFFSK